MSSPHKPHDEPAPQKLKPLTSPLLRSSLTGTQMPVLFYLCLRLRYDKLWASRQLIGVRSYNSLAADLQISSPTFKRLMDFVSLHYAAIEQARASGDWVPVEDRIFSKYGDYRRMPSFQAMLARINPSDRPSQPADALPKNKPGRPPGSKNRPKPPLEPKSSPSFWAKVVGFFRGKPPEKPRRKRSK